MFSEPGMNVLAGRPYKKQQLQFETAVIKVGAL
jgi:hypothetical protein